MFSIKKEEGKIMPPKPKFTKEEIVSEKGIEGLTARELAKALSSSAVLFSPFLTVWKPCKARCEKPLWRALKR